MYLVVDKFKTTDLHGASGIKQVAYDPGVDQVMSRIYTLSNGAIFDADGTSDADVSLGQVTVKYKLISTTGMTSVNTALSTLLSLRGKEGTLQGKSKAASDTTYTCTARCLSVEPLEMTVSDLSGTAGTAIPS